VHRLLTVKEYSPIIRRWLKGSRPVTRRREWGNQLRSFCETNPPRRPRNDVRILRNKATAAPSDRTGHLPKRTPVEKRRKINVRQRISVSGQCRLIGPAPERSRRPGRTGPRTERAKPTRSGGCPAAADGFPALRHSFPGLGAREARVTCWNYRRMEARNHRNGRKNAVSLLFSLFAGNAPAGEAKADPAPWIV
jgi:hypothetical protein